MSIIEIKMALDSFAEMNFLSVGVVALLIFFMFYFILKLIVKRQEQKITLAKFWLLILLSIYVALLLGGTILGRVPGTQGDVELIPFWSYIRLLEEKNYNLLRQMIGNVLIFIPWPILWGNIFPSMRKFHWGVGSAFLFSVFIEVTQLIFKLGLFEFDDMFHNVLGAVIGFCIWKLYRKVKQKGIEE